VFNIKNLLSFFGSLRIYALAALTCVLLLAEANAQVRTLKTEAQVLTEAANLQHDYFQLIDDFYRQEAKVYPHHLSSIPNSSEQSLLPKLQSLFNEHQSKQEQQAATTLLVAHLSFITEQAIDQDVSPWLQHFLAKGLTNSAQAVANRVMDLGDDASQAKTHYLLAKFYFEQGDLNKAQSHLTQLPAEPPLDVAERDYATLLFGIILQKQKRHRDSLKFYQKIGEDSDYAPYARLNEAVAFIRQGWWTDAQLSIDKALAQKKRLKSMGEIKNRLLMVLAYSQFQNSFYRNARENFRQIGLNSIYMERALLGIGLCALAQKDYKGATNAFERLRASGKQSLTVLEANLMMPYTNDHAGKMELASAGYSEAIVYFENQKRRIGANLNNLTPLDLSQYAELAITSPPEFITHSADRLFNLNLDNASAPLARSIKQLRIHYKALLADFAAIHLNKSMIQVNSYLSQSQYGLAKLYDNQK